MYVKNSLILVWPVRERPFGRRFEKACVSKPANLTFRNTPTPVELLAV
jgi:hypothetical protein